MWKRKIVLPDEQCSPLQILMKCVVIVGAAIGRPHRLLFEFAETRCEYVRLYSRTVGDAGPYGLQMQHSRKNRSIRYAERELATSRAVLLDCRQAQCPRPEVPAGAPGAPGILHKKKVLQDYFQITIAHFREIVYNGFVKISTK